MFQSKGCVTYFPFFCQKPNALITQAASVSKRLDPKLNEFLSFVKNKIHDLSYKNIHTKMSTDISKKRHRNVSIFTMDTRPSRTNRFAKEIHCDKNDFFDCNFQDMAYKELQ
eukprot:8758208-Ditylum_brightwellii.AAC.1